MTNYRDVQIEVKSVKGEGPFYASKIQFSETQILHSTATLEKNNFI